MDFNATNSTPNYGLPIFIDTDKPSWLVDWNGAMTELDTVIKEISTSEESNENLISTANANIAKINNTIEEIQAYNTTLTNRVVTLEGKTNKLESEYNTVINDLQAQNRLVLQLQEAINTINTELDNLTNNVIPPIEVELDSLTKIVNANKNAQNVINQQTTQKLTELNSSVENITSNTIPPIEDGLSSLTNMVNKNTDDIQQNSRTIELTTSRLSNLERDVQPLKAHANVVHCLNESGILPATVKDLTEDYTLKNISVVVYADYTIDNMPKMALAPVFISSETSAESSGTFGVETKTILTPNNTAESYTVAVSYRGVEDSKTLNVSIIGNNKVALRAYTATAQSTK
jgi:uncharacterized protein YoxC